MQVFLRTRDFIFYAQAEKEKKIGSHKIKNSQLDEKGKKISDCVLA